MGTVRELQQEGIEVNIISNACLLIPYHVNGSTICLPVCME